MFSVIWWPQKTHVEIEVEREQYEVYLGEVHAPCPSERREENAQKKPGHYFYRFSIQTEPEMLAQLQKDLRSKTIEILSDSCSGSVSQLINRYSPTGITFLESRTPLLLSRALFHKADFLEYVGPQPKLTITKADITSFNHFFQETNFVFYAAGILLCVIGIQTITQFE